MYVNEWLYDIFAGLPYEYVSLEGELNYRLKVMYNNNNLVPRKMLLADPISQGQYEYYYKTVKVIQMHQ